MVPALEPPGLTAANPASVSALSTRRTASFRRAGCRPRQGTDFAFTPTMKSLEPFRDKLLVLQQPRAVERPRLGRRRGRPRARRRDLADRRSSQAHRRRRHSRRHLGRPDRRPGTRQNDQLASLEIGLEEPTLAGSCDTGYSCAYTNTVSWRTPTLRIRWKSTRAPSSSACSATARRPIPPRALRRMQRRSQHPRFRPRGCCASPARSRSARQKQARRIPGRHSRYRAPHSEGGRAERHHEVARHGAPRAAFPTNSTNTPS